MTSFLRISIVAGLFVCSFAPTAATEVPPSAGPVSCIELDEAIVGLDPEGAWTQTGKRYGLDGKPGLSLEMPHSGAIESLARDDKTILIAAQPDPDAGKEQFIAAFDGNGRALWNKFLDLPAELDLASARVAVRAGSDTLRVVNYGSGCRPEGKSCFGANHRQLRPLTRATRLMLLRRDGKVVADKTLGPLPVSIAQFSPRGGLALAGTTDRTIDIDAGPGRPKLALKPRQPFVVAMDDDGKPRWARAVTGVGATLVSVQFAADGSLWIEIASCAAHAGPPATFVGGTSPVPLRSAGDGPWLAVLQIDDAGALRDQVPVAFAGSAPAGCDAARVESEVGLLSDGAQVYLKRDGRFAPEAPLVSLLKRSGDGPVTAVRPLSGSPDPRGYRVTGTPSSLVAFSLGEKRTCGVFGAWGFGSAPFACAARPSARHVTALLSCAVRAPERPIANPPKTAAKDGGP